MTELRDMQAGQTLAQVRRAMFYDALDRPHDRVYVVRGVSRKIPRKLPRPGTRRWFIEVVRRVYALVRDEYDDANEILQRCKAALDSLAGRPPGAGYDDLVVLRWLMVQDGYPPRLFFGYLPERKIHDRMAVDGLP